MINIKTKLGITNHIKSKSNKLHDKLEDLFFRIIMKLPERMIPGSVMDALGRYLDRQIAQTRQQIIKSRWQEVEMNKKLSDIKELHKK